MLPRFNSERSNSNIAMSANEIKWQQLGAELVFTQDIAGNYLSFWWAKAEEYEIHDSFTVQNSDGDRPTSLFNTIFAPVDPQAYLEKIRRVIKRRLPEQCYCLFQCGATSHSFELVISPVLSANREPQAVLVMGHLLEEEEMFSFAQDETPAAIYSYQKLLNQVVGKIRRSLDLETIYQQTVNNVGATFAASRCLILTNHNNIAKLSVEAEYCLDKYDSITEHQISWQHEIQLQQTLHSNYPTAIDFLQPDVLQRKSELVVSTNCNSEDNVLICLQQCDRYRHWGLLPKWKCSKKLPNR